LCPIGGPEKHSDLVVGVVPAVVGKGRIVSREYFWDHAEALEAVGLSEQDARADS
jgi:hypothetical protein